MTWVITRLCRDCVDMSCVEVCPVQCIVGHIDGPSAQWPNQLYIVADECMDCGACEPECPWEAIFEDASVPEALSEDIALNASVQDHIREFAVPDGPRTGRQPTPQDRAANRLKWGLEAP